MKITEFKNGKYRLPDGNFDFYIKYHDGNIYDPTGRGEYTYAMKEGCPLLTYREAIREDWEEVL